MTDLESIVLRGAKFIEIGDPLKDVMDDDDINDAIIMLANLIKDKYGIK